MIIRWHHITREIVKANQEKIFIFGDNLKRRGYGGQAAAMRGEPNSFGIATKRAPGRNEADFFADRPDELDAVAGDLNSLVAIFKTGRPVVIPVNGIGSGFAQLKTRSPQIWKLINLFIDDLEGRK